ncbi:MAG: TolC family protein [Thermoguttaceae bacterium]|jgi:outer membrane protein TolC
MLKWCRRAIIVAALLFVAGLKLTSAGAQGPGLNGPPAAGPLPTVCRITLDEAQQRALANSRLRSLALMNIQAKGEAIFVMEADYYPKVLASFIGFHFDEPLGKVLVPARLPGLGPISVNVFNQEWSVSAITAVQPITALLKVHQGVKVAKADREIACSQARQAEQAIASGVEQLYCGLLAANRILASAQAAAEATGRMPPALLRTPEARIAAVEGKQAIQAVSSQASDLAEQLNSLLDLPLGTRLELVELPPLAPTITCADQAIDLALRSSPDVFQADQTVAKAEAGLQVAKVDYLPDVAVMGGYFNQNGLNVIQSDVTYGALVVNYPIFEGGKRVHAVHEAETVVAMARQKACQTRDELRLKAQKAYREFVEAQAAIDVAGEMVQARKEAQQKAGTPESMITSATELMKAEAALVQANAVCRVAYVKLSTIAGVR